MCSGAAESVTCSSNLLYQDVYDTAPLTNFYCDAMTETGFVMYKSTPTGGKLQVEKRKYEG